MEQPRFSRITFKADAVITSEATAIAARTTELSLEGTYVRTPQRIPLNATVEVRIVASATDPQCSISARAVIARHDDQGMGLAFNAMEFESFFVLARLVSEGLSDRSRAARELLDFLHNPPGNTENPTFD